MTKPNTTTGTRLNAAETTNRRNVALGVRVMTIQVVAPRPDLKSGIPEISPNPAPE